MVSFAGAAAFAVGGLLLPWRPRLGGAGVALGLLAAAVSIAPNALEQPQLLVVGVVVGLVVWRTISRRPTLAEVGVASPPTARQSARGAAVVGLSVYFVEVLAREGSTSVDHALSAAAMLPATFLAVRWARGARPGVRRLTAAVAVTGTACASASTWLPVPATTGLALALLLVLALTRGDDDQHSALARLTEHPARLLVATFAALVVVGAALLALPVASANGHTIGVLDAVFTAASAVCVTGLIVLDTPAAFSGLGQAVILALIQIGGLGIMTFYTVAFAALGRRLSLRHERAIAGAMNVDDRRALVSSLRRVLAVTVAAEGAGALLLAGAFAVEGDALGTALWRGVFTSISAFCNAGFALQTDSLVPYQTSPFILYTVAALIVAGGLSPVAVLALPRWLRGARVPLQVHLISIASAVLLVVGAVIYAAFEWSDTLGHLSWGDRVHNAIFQSVTLRTAGFNTVDLSLARPETLTVMIAFMLIGGSPGGTAGGVKTTTLVVILLMVGAALRGGRDPSAFGRRIGTSTVFKAGAVVTVGVAALLAGLVAVQLTQSLDLSVAAFEVASALGTVGLSIGGTAMLDEVGKIIVIGLMFAGRVGPLTLFVFLTEREEERALHYPVEEVDVG
ncbi:MAG: hypothetical protein KF729_24140 [Sandaracinaceae bacterium]|nr:hypothetical protein [Sandaracinaceae bacterium]